MNPPQVRRLSPALGAEVIDLDVTASAAAETVTSLIAEHQVVAVRNQQLTPDELVMFARRLGDPAVHPLVPHLDGHPEIQEIRNSGKRVTLNEHWHTDVSFEERPPKYTMLFAREVPDIGGDTQFADQYAAYDSLSPGLRDTLDGLRAEHRGEGLALAMGRDPSDAPSAMHPIARTHPETGRRALYVCRAFTRRVEGWTAGESAGLLQFLYERSSRPDFTYRHRWQTGDLVLWDNRCVLHYAIHDHGDDERLLHRITVHGERPV